MIRFIDLGKQIGLGEEWPRQFAFWDTIYGHFITINGEQAWESWTELAEALKWNESDEYLAPRLRSLCHPWVFHGVVEKVQSRMDLYEELSATGLYNEYEILIKIGLDPHKPPLTYQQILDAAWCMWSPEKASWSILLRCLWPLHKIPAR